MERYFTLVLFTILHLISLSQADQSELLDYAVNIDTWSPSLLGHIISHEMKEKGFVFVNNSNIGNSIRVNFSNNKMDGLSLLSQTVLNVSDCYVSEDTITSDFSYTFGNVAGRKEVISGLFRVSGAPPNVLVTGHSEASYLLNVPPYLIFSCPGLPNLKHGGQTTVYDIDLLVNTLKSTAIGMNLLNDVAKYGVIYIRNDPSEININYKQIWDFVKYPLWEKRFDGLTMNEINDLYKKTGYQQSSWIKNISYDNHGNVIESYTLHTEWKMPGFRLHPFDNNKIVWFNQLFAMNGRYFNNHNVDNMEKVPLNKRPLHTLIGNGRELTDDEYDLLNKIHNDISILIPWDNTGDIMAVDNFRWQHGRMPYNSQRRCLVHWGPGVEGGKYVYNPSHFRIKSTESDRIKHDLNAVYKLLQHLKYFNTEYKHISYRLKDDKYIIKPERINNIANIYKDIYKHRSDINVILHINNPDITAMALSSSKFLAIDQSFYMLYPVTYCFNNNECGNNNIADVLGTQSRLLLINSNGINGLIVLGSKVDEAFTRLYYAIRAARSQILTCSIHNDINDIIFPPQYIQEITINQSLNFNDDGYGYLEFKAWKRRYNLQENGQNPEIKTDLINAEFSAKESTIRKELTNAYHILDKLGWVETIYQHCTVMYDDSMIINAYGLEFGEITPNNLMKVKLNGDIIYGGDSVRAGFINPSGLELHAAVHESRDDAKVVIHVHHSAISAISVHHDGLLTSMIEPEIRLLLGKIAYHDFDSLSLAINRTELSKGLQNGTNVIILRNHGILTIGKTVQIAFDRLYHTITAAQTQINLMITQKNNYKQFDSCELINDNVHVDNDLNSPWNRFVANMDL